MSRLQKVQQIYHLRQTRVATVITISTATCSRGVLAGRTGIHHVILQLRCSGFHWMILEHGILVKFQTFPQPALAGSNQAQRSVIPALRIAHSPPECNIVESYSLATLRLVLNLQARNFQSEYVFRLSNLQAVSDTEYQEGTTTNCTEYLDVTDGWGCQDILNIYHLTISQFFQYNPSIGSDCSGLWLGLHHSAYFAPGSTNTPKTISTASAPRTTSTLVLLAQAQQLLPHPQRRQAQPNPASPQTAESGIRHNVNPHVPINTLTNLPQPAIPALPSKPSTS